MATDDRKLSFRKPQDVRRRDRKVTDRPLHRKRGIYILHAIRVSGKPAPWAGVTLPILKSRFVYAKSWPTERKNENSERFIRTKRNYRRARTRRTTFSNF